MCAVRKAHRLDKWDVYHQSWFLWSEDILTWGMTDTQEKNRLAILEDGDGRMQGENESYYTMETVKVKPGLYLHIVPSFTKWDDVQNTK